MRKKVFDFSKTFKAYAVGIYGAGENTPLWVSRRGLRDDVPGFDTVGDPQYCLTSEDLKRLYLEAHDKALFSRDSDGKPWPADIKVYEADVRLCALSLTCREVSRYMAEAVDVGRDHDPVSKKFYWPVPSSEYDKMHDLYIFWGAMQKHADGKTHIHHNLFDVSGLKKGVVQDKILTDIKDAHLVLCEGYGEALTVSAHKAMLGFEQFMPGIIGRGDHLVLAGLFANKATLKSADMSTLEEDDTHPVHRIVMQLADLGF